MGCTETLRQQGYRLTAQRRLILSTIHQRDNHISAEDIYSKVHAKYPRVNISTVYRTLELLKGLGLVTETDLGEGKLRYHFAERGHHHHLICEKCGRVLERDVFLHHPLKDALQREYNFRADL